MSNQHTLQPEFPVLPGARCAGSADPDAFFLDRHDARRQDAIDLCDGCPCATRCLTWALDNNEQGVWAGTTYWQRRARKKAS